MVSIDSSLVFSNVHVQSAHYPSPLASPPDYSIFIRATEDEIIKLISDCPNKQCGLDAIPTSLLKHCCHILAPVITRTVNLSLSQVSFAPNSSNPSSLLC